jgi:mono/diheme cytochrome c family protein
MKRKKLLFIPLLGSMFLFSCGGDSKTKEVTEEKVAEVVEIEEVTTHSDPSGTITLTQTEMDEGTTIYFNNCVMCHGPERKGDVGPSLLPHGDGKAPSTVDLGVEGIKGHIENGTMGGMPEWKGILTDAQISLMAKFLQIDPPMPPSNYTPTQKTAAITG